MRTLGEILEDVLDNKTVTNEELRYTVLALREIGMAERILAVQLVTTEPDMARTANVIKQIKENYFVALKKSPEDIIGLRNPDNPKFQELRKVEKELFQGLTSKS